MGHRKGWTLIDDVTIMVPIQVRMHLLIESQLGPHLKRLRNCRDVFIFVELRHLVLRALDVLM